jgi:hypothetical protein
MKIASFIILAVFSTLICSCKSKSPQEEPNEVILKIEKRIDTEKDFVYPNNFIEQAQNEIILDVDTWFEARRVFGNPHKFNFTHQDRNYLVIINCPYSGRAATFSYILEEQKDGHVLLQVLHHPEGSIAQSVELKYGSLVFKDHTGRPVLSFLLTQYSFAP